MFENLSCFAPHPSHLVDLKNKKKKRANCGVAGDVLNLFLHEHTPLWYRNKRSSQTLFLDFTNRWVMLNISVSEPQGAMRTPLTCSLAVGPWVQMKLRWWGQHEERFPAEISANWTHQEFDALSSCCKIHTEGQLARFPHFFTAGREIMTSSSHLQFIFGAQ